MLDWKVVAILLVALRHIAAHHRLAAQLIFDLREASAAFDFRLAWSAASAGDLIAGTRVHAPTVTSGAVMLFGAEEAVLRATGSVETGCAGAAT